MNIIIGLASMTGCAGMFLVCAMQLQEMWVAARALAPAPQPWQVASRTRLAPLAAARKVAVNFRETEGSADFRFVR